MSDVTEFPLHGVPRAEPDAVSAPFWTGLAEGRLLAPRCRTCGRFHFPSSPTCPHCGGLTMDWQELAATPVVYSWIVVHRATHPEIPVPYAVVLGEFPEGVRVPGNMPAEEAERLNAGTPLAVTIGERDGSRVLVYRHG